MKTLHAEGKDTTRTGKVRKEHVKSFGVRCDHDVANTAIGIWVDGSFSTGWISGYFEGNVSLASLIDYVSLNEPDIAEGDQQGDSESYQQPEQNVA